jgi:Ca2+-binding EF-hand superfamily protein
MLRVISRSPSHASTVEPEARREYFRFRDNEKNATRRLRMLPRIILALSMLIGASAALAQSAVAEVAVDAALMKVLDPDADGTVDLAEAKAAGAAVFKKLDPDNDGTLDAKELSGRLDEAELKAADPDNDGTLDMNEYNAEIEKLFKAADPDNDGTLDEKELKSPAGQKLLLLIA